MQAAGAPHRTQFEYDVSSTPRNTLESDWSRSSETVTLLRILGPALSALLLAAHFLRAGQTAGVAASLALLALIAVPRRSAARAAQVALLAGAAEWLRTLFRLVAARREANAPYGRLVLILAAVAAATAASAFLLRTPRPRDRDRSVPRRPPEDTGSTEPRVS